MRAIAIAVGLSLLAGSASAASDHLTTNVKPHGHRNDFGVPSPWWADPCPYREADGACPDGAVPENEPLCGDGYIDWTNGGCNSFPPVYSDVPCAGAKICGEYGTFNSGTTRDTDWYRYTACENLILNATLCGSANNPLFIVDGIASCDPVAVAADLAGPHDQAAVSYPLTAGQTVVVFVATQEFGGVPCGSPYVLRVWPTPPGPGQLATGVDLAESAARLDRPVPNPFTESTRMAFAVSGAAPQTVDVAVFNVAGQKIRTLLQGTRSPGRYEAAWDGADESGVQAPAGHYFFRVISGAEQTVRRVSLIR